MLHRFTSNSNDDDPFASQVGSSNQSTCFAARLQQASPIAVPPVASLTTFMGKDGGYSQSLQQPSIFGVEPLQPAVSALFESGTEKQTTGDPSSSPYEGRMLFYKLNIVKKAKIYVY
jgi:hypothetical protein